MKGDTPPRRWLRAFRLPWRTPRRDVDAELRFHFDERVADLVAAGADPDEARRTATAEFGDPDAVRAELIAIDTRIARREHRALWWEHIVQDVVFAWRGIRGAPVLAAVTVLTIALGVGATTAVLAVADTLILRPIGYPDASRVFVLRRESPTPTGFPSGPIPVPTLEEWRENAHTIEASVAFQAGATRAFVNGTDTTTARVAFIERGFLAFAGVRPLIGRDFTVEEATENGPSAVMLGEGTWRREFGSSANVLGKTVRVGSALSTIVGVLPASLALPDFRAERPDVWVPLRLGAEDFMVSSVAVRLKPGVSRAAADAEAATYLKTSPLDAPWNRDIKWRVRLSRPDEGLKFRQALTMLTGAVALLLLVACANVAHLFLARGAVRERELAVRHALGAGRGRLLRHLLTESALLAAIGGLLATGVAWAGLRLLAAARPDTLVALTYPSAGRGMFSFAAMLAVGAGLAVGALSAFRSAGRDIGQSLRAGTSLRRSAAGLRRWIVVGEVGLSTTLLVGALLLIHAVFGLEQTRLGFDDRDLYNLAFATQPNESADSRAALAANLQERAAQIAGPQNITEFTIGFVWLLSRFDTPARPATSETSGVAVNAVKPDYFRMMGIPFVAGHTFDASSAARNEVVISTSLARAIWGDDDPVGRQFRNSRTQAMAGSLEPWRTVIGVVPDAITNLLQTSGAPAIYESFDRRLNGAGNVAVMIRLPGRDAPARLRALAKDLRPDPSGRTIRLVDVADMIYQSTAEPRFTMRVLATFAALGVVMAAVGLFGVISYGVRQRYREIGVRMALGATHAGIARLIVGEGVRMTLGGIVIGSVGALATSRLLQGMLYGVSRVDPFAFGASAALLVAVAIVACIVPMVRATTVDPIVVARSE